MFMCASIPACKSKRETFILNVEISHRCLGVLHFYHSDRDGVVDF